jgi:signal transduction histidine kinase
MTWDFTQLSSMYLLAAFVLFFASFLNWNRRSQPGILHLTGMLLFIAIWSTFRFLEYSVVQVDLKFLFFKLENLSAEIFIASLFLFVVDFFHLLSWFSPKRRSLLWVAILILNVVDWTNPFHHLSWTGYSQYPTQPNMIIFERGPLAALKIIFIFYLVTYSLLLLIHSIVNQTGWNRIKAAVILAAMLFPFGVYVISVRAFQDSLMIFSAPFGFAVTGLFMAWIVYKDLEIIISANTEMLRHTIANLQDEIIARQRLEADLRTSQEALAIKLAGQSNKLAGLYDLILFSNETIDYPTLMQKSLEKVVDVMGGDAACFYRQTDPYLVLDAQYNLPTEIQKEALELPSEWMLPNRDVRADIHLDTAPDLPELVQKSGYCASLMKRVVVQDKDIGLLVVLWHAEKNFSVEEIILYAALCDGLGLILQNSRLRAKAQEAAARVERRRLARDLHDSVTQSLHSLTLSAQTARRQMNENQPGLKSTLEHLEVSARQALKEMRLMLYEMRLTSAEDGGLVDMMRTRLEAVEQRSGINTALIVSEHTSWQKKWEPELFPLAQEALNNALKHAYATRVRITMAGNRKNFFMEIYDNGVGFVPDRISSGGMGLHNMQDRCEKIGARLQIQSRPEKGTAIRVVIGQVDETLLTEIQE